MHGGADADPATKLGIISSGPLPRWEGETIPDQNGRRWADDGEEHDEPPNPGSDPLTSAAHDGAHNYRAKRPCSLAAAHCWCASGARSLILVSRRRGLYQASIPSKIACDSWTFVSYRWVSRTSRYIVDQTIRIIALSTEATRPIEPGSLAWRGRCPNARTCIALVAMTDRARRRLPSPTRHLQGIDDQVGA